MSDRVPGGDADGAPEVAETEDDVDLDLDTEGEGDEGAGDEADSDAGGDGEDEEAEGDDVEPAPRRGGGAVTPRNLRRRAQEAERALAAEKAERAALDTRLRQLEQARAVDPQAAARAAAERAERRRLMSPDELIADVTQELRADFGGALQTLHFQQADALDKQEYRLLAVGDKMAAAYAGRVEQALVAERAAGRNHTREAILNHMLGQDTRKKAARVAPAQRRAAASRVAGQTTRPAGARGGAAPGRRAPAEGPDADAATLEHMRRNNIPLW